MYIGGIMGTLFTQSVTGGVTGTATNTVWLAPQTTPFTNRADAESFCQPSVRCEGKIGDVKVLTPLSCRPSYVYPGDRGFVTADRYPDCFPDGYYSIDFELAAAYPGTACRAGWYTACSTTFRIGPEEHSQVWCCPNRNYQCGTTNVKYALTPSATMRVCVSMVSVLTFVETVQKKTQANQLTTRSTTVPSDQALPYRIQAFPLAMPAVTAGSSSGSVVPEPSASNTVTTGTDDGASATSTLTRGQIAGLVVGAMAFIGLVFALVAMQVRRRRRRGYAMPELPAADDLKTEDAPRVELEGCNMYPEMSSEREPVEAPFAETQSTPLIFHKGAAGAEEDESPVIPRCHLG